MRAPSRARRSAIRIVVALLGTAALLAAAWFFVVRDRLAPPAATGAPAAVAIDAAEHSDAAPPEPARDAPVETSEVFAPKDPFKPLIEVDEVARGKDAKNGSEPQGDGLRIKLLDSFMEKGTRRVHVKVDSKVHPVDEGEIFASSFKLVAIHRSCAILLFGDDQFRLCEGDEIIK